MLRVLSAEGSALTAAEVALRMDPAPAYTTVLTALSRLHDKGALSRVRRGRAYAYSFQRDEAALRAVKMRRLLEGGQDSARVLARFVDELSPDDERLLQRLLNEQGGDLGS